ncbi:protein LURP-one-related 8-like [Panicum virgatum]|uniref:protein LURP-one-related 8-like n=1 Tax=Panicum virgatum TaxID=38727 RepID=UPI0019D54A28|nr:protein LURP-one-related 8-like [Panicum virgatum]
MHPVPPRSSPGNIAAATRVHPSDADALHHSCPAAADHQPALYTVWKRSSMGFQGTDGFCVYDDAGALAFRVDNYSRRRKLFAGELLLMDGHGAPLLALRPQSAVCQNLVIGFL